MQRVPLFYYLTGSACVAPCRALSNHMIFPKITIFMPLLCLACRQHTPPPKKDVPAKPPVQNVYFAQKPSKYYFNYDSKKSEIENFDSGYVDTFSIAGTRFRLFSNPDSSNDLEMQVMTNGQWTTNFKTFYAADGNLYENDVNNDGFADFEQIMRNGEYVFLYDPHAKRFVDSSITLSTESELLDKQANIYYEVWPQNSPYWISDVYQFKGLRLHCLFELCCIEDDTIMFSAGRIRVYKCTGNNLADSVFIREEKIGKDFDEFDYKKYWRSFLRANRHKH
jgi:hypothetical protein